MNTLSSRSARRTWYLSLLVAPLLASWGHACFAQFRPHEEWRAPGAQRDHILGRGSRSDSEGGYSGGQQSPTETRQRQLADQASAAVKQGNLTEALRLAREALRTQDASWLRDWIARLEAFVDAEEGEKAWERGDLEAALSHFRRVMSTRPDILTDAGRNSVEELARRVDDRHTMRNIAPVLSASASAFQIPASTKPTPWLPLQDRQSISAGSQAADTRQIQEIVAGIRHINVPPPIPSNEVLINFGQLAPGDDLSKRILLGSDVGVAVASVSLKMAGKSLHPGAKLIYVSGKVLIAGEDAADLYLVQQNAVYESALRYLRDERTRSQFTELVRTIKENNPIPEGARSDMIRAARAIVDPALGNSSVQIAVNALLSPDARRAMYTAACIEAAGEILGHSAGQAYQRIEAVRRVPYQQARYFLARAHVALRTVKDPGARESLQIAVRQANKAIADTYRALAPSADGLSSMVSIFATESESSYRTQARP